MKYVSAFCGLIFCPSLLFAVSIHLVNNSPFDLKAMMRGKDGSILGEIIVKSQRSTDWTDNSGQFGWYGGANANQNRYANRQAPYTVLWYCLDGGDFSVCRLVSTGSVVTSEGCAGRRTCTPKRKPVYPPLQPEGHYLHKEEKPDSPTQ